MSRVVAMSLGLSLLAMSASVATMGGAMAACATPPASVSLSPVDELLKRYPEGGAALVNEVRNIVAADPTKLGAVAGLAAQANAAQKSALGAGLGQAAGVCIRPDPEAAAAIQETVLKLTDREVLAAFQAVTGDRQTAAVGGGGAAGGGPGGGGVAGQPGGFSSAGSGFFANSTSVTPGGQGGYNPGSGSLALRASRNLNITNQTSVSRSQ